MLRILNRARLIIYRAILYGGLGVLFLLVGYVISIGPVYAFMHHNPDVFSIDMRSRIFSFYSPIYYPCCGWRPFYYQLDHYITFWTRLM